MGAARQFLLHYGIASGTCAVALLLALGLASVTTVPPTLLFAAAVVISAWAGGLGPGLLASLLSLFLLDFVFLVPRYALHVTSLDDTIQLALFAAVALVVSGLNAARRTAQHRAEAAQQRLAYLAEVSGVLVSSLDDDVILQRVAQVAVPAMADWCCIDIVQPDGRIARLAVAQADPTTALPAAIVRRHPPPGGDQPGAIERVLRTGQTEVVTDLDDTVLATLARSPEHLVALQALGATTCLIVPLPARDRVLGTLLLVMAESGRRHGPDAVRLAEEVARRAALAVDNALLYRQAQRALGREQAARAQAEQLATERAAVLGHIADGVVIADPAGVLTFVNEAAAQLLGAPRPGTMVTQIGDGASVQVLTVAGEPAPPAAFPLARASLAGDTVLDVPLRLRQADGTDVVVRASARPVVADHGCRLGAVLTLHDMTAQHQLERQKDEFFASISHDLRTPLAGLKASIGVVLANEPPGLPASLHRLLVNIDLTVDRMARLVNDLLELTRIQAGRVQLERTIFELRAFVQQSLRTIEPLAQTRQQGISLEGPDQPLLVLADPDRLERAVLNLLSNAHQYGRPGGCIQVRLVAGQGEAIVRVTDDGPGIPLHEQQRIFERFYRAQSGGTGHNQGSGLGLTIARATVELHGGRIWVESTPGAGATFSMALPLAPTASAAGRTGDDEDSGGG